MLSSDVAFTLLIREPIFKGKHCSGYIVGTTFVWEDRGGSSSQVIWVYFSRITGGDTLLRY